MTKRRAAALAKVFAAEIDDRLPFQSNARIYRELLADGLLIALRAKLGGRFPIEVDGFALSEPGRLIYCEWAAKQPLDTKP